ncbi:DUF924 family protein [Sphingomonas sp. R1]|uniref:DUF924 family protein n=1 Tax=Sphingomonas sp. R1 TaxID=399176 RepID=UPI00222441E9|nr:DUF924 family protein [Sphingomonas sp. R1]UYY77728.1 DUF924 domain-containing protein [Sphingomonas sp. R1]
MASDLRTPTAEVQRQAGQVLAFWFDALLPEQWFRKSDGLDREIADLFGDLRNRVLASDAAGWDEDPETLLAAVILLDQFSRNIHRGRAEAFAGDRLAQHLARLAVDRHWDLRLSKEQRQFLYLPFEHAEDAELQALSLRCFAALEDDELLRFARDHADVFRRFGRFPARNVALGRISTPDELDYLSQPGAGW